MIPARRCTFLSPCEQPRAQSTRSPRRTNQRIESCGADALVREEYSCDSNVCRTNSCNVHAQLCAPVSRYLVLGVQVTRTLLSDTAKTTTEATLADLYSQRK